ncbi:MAG: intradiol ring-cleavage dioxygenase, partial [Pirellulaceae bacterium]|nr:intradiol ring-cleavage dioxygenase [Pirellulaceae bacterium]
FQGYGRFMTSSTGKYYFRTIKPVAYPGRTPHIHIAVSTNGKRIFTSQILEKGNRRNETDGLYQRVPDPKQRETFLAEYKPVKNCPLGSLDAGFNVVLGHTAEENEDGTIKGAIGKPTYRRR